MDNKQVELKKPESKEECLAALEAVLFASGNSVKTETLADMLGKNKEETEALLLELQESFHENRHGIFVAELNGSWQFGTKPAMYDYLVAVAMQPKKPNLTEAMMETLSIIAYKQPCTKQEIEKIRGVKSDHAVNRLVEYNLVKELGRLDAPGKPIVFGTTEEFLRCFGVSSSENLPEINPVTFEDFKQEAEEEMQKKITVTV